MSHFKTPLWSTPPQTEPNTLLRSSSFTTLGLSDYKISSFPQIQIDAKSYGFNIINISVASSLFLSALSSSSFTGGKQHLSNNTFKSWNVNLKVWNLMNKYGKQIYKAGVSSLRRPLWTPFQSLTVACHKHHTFRNISKERTFLRFLGPFILHPFVHIQRLLDFRLWVGFPESPSQAGSLLTSSLAASLVPH